MNELLEEEYWYWFCNLKNIFIGKQKKLINAFGHPKYVFNASESELKEIGSMAEEDIKNIIGSKKSDSATEIRNEIKAFRERGIDFVYYTHEKYPSKLKLIDDAPYILYFIGMLPDSNKPSVAIVGTRMCTEYGRKIAYSLGKELSLAGIQVISGMANGIDGAAQTGVIDEEGETFAVLGCGVDVCYPRNNIDIYTRIQKNGGIISEYPIASKPLAWQFPLRNRIISGLADIIIVVEAKEKSGSLITVEYGLEQGKDIFAVPGRITDKLSAGCNRLIKQGAGVLTDVKDIFQELGIQEENSEVFLGKNKITLAKDLQVVYSCLDLLPKSLDTIVQETGVKSSDVLQALIRLQLLDLVCEPVINYYSRNI